MNPSDESQETLDSARPTDDLKRARDLQLLHETEEMFKTLQQNQMNGLQAKISLLLGGKH